MYATESQQAPPLGLSVLAAPSIGRERERVRIEPVHVVHGRIRFRCPELRFDRSVSGRLSGAIIELPGVTSVRVNTWCSSVIVTFDEAVLPNGQILHAIRKLDLSERPNSGAAKRPQSGVLSRIASRGLSLLEKLMPPAAQFILGALAFSSSLFHLPRAIAVGLSTAAVVPIAGRALQTLIEEKRVGVDGLDGLAAALMIAQGNVSTASFMTLLIGMGEYIRELTARRCKKILDDLLGLAGRSAWLVKGHKRICIPADHVVVGDTVVIYPGELVPVDGTVIDGQASVNQASLTGESMPVEVGPDAPVYAGTLVLEGKVYVRCQATSQDSRAGQALELVKAAPIYDTRTQNYAAAVADRMVLPILGTAAACGLATSNLSRVMSVLIFDFSTGIRIAAPTAVLASMHQAGRQGILIKSGSALERLSKLDAIVLDKTGTLTLGEPKVTDVVALNGVPPERLLSLAASAEQRIHHPAALAIVKHAKGCGIPILDRIESNHKAGLGVGALVEGVLVQVGSARMMHSARIDTASAARCAHEAHDKGESLAYIALDGVLSGVIAYSDQLRPEVPSVISMLRARGIKKFHIATGDHEAAARSIASMSGISEVYSGAFPEQKAQLVHRLKAEGYTVAVVGDGINDSAALAHADLGISLHSATAAAREHADVLLTDNDLRRLPQAIDLARDAMSLVRENLAFVTVPNAVGLALAAAGAIGPAMSTVLNNGSAIVAALNSLRPLLYTGWSEAEEAPSRSPRY